tara:strand:- start:2238 stop:3149 length:912 start_codon:yes stop_codon:yes gene_type:complete
MATSGTTTFDLQIDDIIEEAYERCGLRTNSGHDIRSARRSLNLLFSEWGNRGVHLWKVNLNQIVFTAGVATYSAPIQVNDVLEAYISSTGAVNGTLNSALTTTSTSVVLTDASAFGTTGTVQIGLEFITYTGKSTNTLTGATRGALGSLAVAHVSGVAVQNITGQGTSNTNDIALTKIDRSAYSALPNKLATGQPSQYFIDRQTQPTISLYLAPDASTYTTLKYYSIDRIQDAGTYTNNPDVPFRFLPCMCSGLAYYLSQKRAPDRIQLLKQLYEDELLRALNEDGSRTSVYISPQSYFPGGV